MNYISVYFYLFLLITVIFYYAFPLQYRWYILGIGSIVFYDLAAPKALPWLLVMILLSYGAGILIEYQRRRGISLCKKRLSFALLLSVLSAPLIFLKLQGFFLTDKERYGWIIFLGLSFYTLQMIAYLADIYKGKIASQRNLIKYGLFISFFPQIIQGPIPRYEQLGIQLWTPHRFEERTFSKGLLSILWGLFLKLMIADKASVIVNTVFSAYQGYPGMYLWVAAILYGILLYADFLSCVCIAQGSAGLFGIELAENFDHPYFARSIKEFWKRWHLSLSHWLRDYVYIPLGGSRKGKLRKYGNLMAVFLLSGFWHGNGLQYLVWGALHGIYQITGDLTSGVRSRLAAMAGFSEKSFGYKTMQRLITFWLVTIGWVFFRSDSVRQGFEMVHSMFTIYNPWILWDDTLFLLGLSWKEWNVLLLSVLGLAAVECLQQKYSIRDKILEQPLFFRWMLYLLAIGSIWIFGSYGSGFNAQDFIYGGF